MNTKEWDDEIDLRLIAARLWRRRWWVIISVVLSSTAFAAAAFMMTPIYRASTLLVSASSERGPIGGLGSALGQLGGLASLAGVSIGSRDAETEEALAVLSSRQFTERFISDNNLMPKLYSRKWDAKNSKWKVSDKDLPTLAKANEYFGKRIRTVIQDKKTGLITLQIDWKDRDEAAVWANELVGRLNSEMRARAITKTDASIGYLEKELKETSLIGTQEAINRLVESQIKQRMLASVSPEYSFRVVDRAMTADEDDPIEPKKSYLLIAGPFVGLAFGAIFVLLAGMFQRPVEDGKELL